jgi:hypothetical protein
MTVVDQPRRVVLSVPHLGGPPVGRGCCAISRDDVLVDELDSWPGLRVVEVDPDAGMAVVLVSGGCDDLPAALEALADRGLAAAAVHSTASHGSGRHPDPTAQEEQHGI